MLLGFSIFYILAILKSHSKLIRGKTDVANVHCDKESRWQPRSSTRAMYFLPGWNESNIYPMKLCATVKGAKVGSCEHTTKWSHLRLYFVPRVKSPIKPEYFFESDTHCHTFNASEIAAKLPVSVKPIMLKPVASLWGIPKSNERTTIQLFIKVAAYYFYKEGTTVADAGDGLLHAVVCNFPNCVVTFKGPHKNKTTEYFRKENGRFPRPETGPGPVTAETFSVTSIECDGAKCPTEFSANKVEPRVDTTEPKEAPTEAPPTALLQKLPID